MPSEGEKTRPYTLGYSGTIVFPFQLSGQAVVTGVVSSPPLPVLAFIFIAERVQHSHRSSSFIDFF